MVTVVVVSLVDSRLVRLMERFVLIEVRFVVVGPARNVSLEFVDVFDLRFGRSAVGGSLEDVLGYIVPDILGFFVMQRRLSVAEDCWVIVALAWVLGEG